MYCSFPHETLNLQGAVQAGGCGGSPAPPARPCPQQRRRAAGGRKGHAPSLASLQRLHALLSAHDSPVLRHLAFAALMRCGGLAPTLFREEEDVGPAAAAGAALKQIPGLCAPS